MTSPHAHAPLNVLVTGGSGFLGRAIVRELLQDDAPLRVGRVRILDIRDYAGVTDPRIEFVRGDVRHPEDVGKACTGIDLVIHTAAIVDWGTQPPKEVYRVNYLGTQHVVQACQEKGVSMLVYASSLDTVITGRPLRDIDESQPYPAKHLNMYCESKCLAEQHVLAAHGERLRTVALRPSDIYGEGDPYHIPPLIDMAKSGFYVRIGDGTARSQHVYVGNMAWAFVLAARALAEGNHQVGGNAYFITDGPGSNFFTFFDDIVMRAGYKIRPRALWLPCMPTYGLGALAEAMAFLVRPIRYYNPKLSRFAVMYTTTDFTFTAGKAQRDFCFAPKYGPEEAMAKTVDYFRKGK
jgi:nucleoside-diphosphate-sugar epimerase